MKDFERFKTYFKDNLCFDMFKFALDDNYENKLYEEMKRKNITL